MNVDYTNRDIDMEEMIIKAVHKALLATHHQFIDSGWLALKDGAKYAGVSYNTFLKFRGMGLKICEVDGVKRVSRKEIDSFLGRYSF